MKKLFLLILLSISTFGQVVTNPGAGSVPNATTTTPGKVRKGDKATYPLAQLSDGTLPCASGNVGQGVNISDADRIPRRCLNTTGSVYEWVRERDFINAKDFGAVGDDSTDDTTALQAAFDAARTYDVALWIPGATYKTTATLTWHASVASWGKPVRIRGDGSRKTIIKLYGATNIPVLSIKGNDVSGGTNDISQGFVSDLGLAQNSGTGNIGLRLQGVSYTTFRGIQANSFTSGTGIEIYQTGGSGDSDLVSLCTFQDIQVHSNANGFAVNATSGYMAFAQSRFINVYAQDNTVNGFLLSNFDGIEMTKCLAIGDNITAVGIYSYANGLYNRNLLIRGGELGNGCTEAAIKLGNTIGVKLIQNRIIRNDGEAQSYGVYVPTGSTVTGFSSDQEYFQIGAAIVTYTGYQLDGTINAGIITNPFWGVAMTGGLVEVSDTTKVTYQDGATVTDTLRTHALGATNITANSATALTAGRAGTTTPAFTVNTTNGTNTGVEIQSHTAGSGARITATSSATDEALRLTAKGAGVVSVLSPFHIGSVAPGTAYIYLLSSTAGLTGFRFTGLNSQLIYGLNGTSANYSDGDTNYWRSGDGLTIFGTLTSASMAWTRPNHITSTSANALAVGANGTTNPVLKVDASTASVATGVSITGAAAGGNVAIAAISSGSNESLRLSAKGTGSVAVYNSSLALTNVAVTATSGGTTTLDLSTGNIRTVTMPAGNTTITASNVPVGFITIAIIQDSGGSRTVTWNSLFKFPGAAAPTLTTTGNARDQINFQCDGTNCYYLSAALDVR